MDGAIVVIAADQPLNSKPQLIQHLAAAKLNGLGEKLIICLNKIDIVSKEILYERKKELDELLLLYDIKPFIIIPTCFNKKINMDILLNSIMELFNPETLLKRTNDLSLFRISRTFDINKPGTKLDNLVGGVIGGSLSSGILKIGDMIEIRPGQISKNICQPIKTKIMSIKTDENNINEIISGGLVAIGTNIDPYYTKNDAMIGNIAGLVGTLPSVYIQTTIHTQIIKIFGFTWEPKINDLLTLQIETKMVEAKLININDNNLTFELSKPTCIPDNQHIIICKNINKIIRIVGDGIMYPDMNNNKLIV